MFEEEYQSLLTSNNPLLADVCANLYSHKGKRLRPILTLLCAQMCNECNERTITAATALELIHAASLLHDDVVDMSDKRRGNPSVNAQWNNKIAILAGDYLLTKAMQAIAALRNQKIINVILNMAQTLASGEVSELHYNSSMWITEKQYLSVIRQKTATLFAACAETGALSVGATLRQQTALKTYGENLGICFQMKDDELDYSDIEEIGKPRMNDIRDGKATLPLLVALKRAPRAEAEEIKSLCEQPFTNRTEQEVKSFVLRYEGLRYARQKMEEYRAKAIDALGIFSDSVTKDALLDLLNYSINRLY